MKNKNFVTQSCNFFAIICLSLLVGCSCTESGHPFHLKNVTNFARKINNQDVGAIDSNWLKVLKRQPIVASKNRPSFEAMKAINDNCNHKAYKISPLWQTPQEIVNSGSTDCKGFAICKYYALRKAGFKAEQLNLWSGDYRGQPHMILVARLEAKQYVLDIGANANLPEAKNYFYHSFEPSYRFNENGWDF